MLSGPPPGPPRPFGLGRSYRSAYFRLALEYATGGSGAMVLIVMGRVGSGKSTLARALGSELGWPVASSDRVRKELAGVALHHRGGAEERRRLYGKAMSNRTYARLARMAAESARRGRPLILDATFSSRQRRDRLREVLERAGIRHCFVEVRAATAAIHRRLKERENSPREISDARLEDFPALDSAYEPPTELDSRHFIAARSAPLSGSSARTTLKMLARKRAADRPSSIPATSR